MRTEGVLTGSSGASRGDEAAGEGALQALTAFVIDNPDLERLEALLSQFNIFEAIGVERQELRHSDFLAFLLDPRQSHRLGDRFVTRLLQRAVLEADPGVAGVSPIDLELWSLAGLVVQREWRNIDLLLVDREHELVVMIENKIGSREHSAQLSRYLAIVRRHYPGWTTLAFYLTPDGDLPSDEAYLPLSYDLVCEVVEHLAEAQRPSLDPAVQTMLSHYARMLRRHVVSDSEIADLCQRIYQRHKQALDLIFEHRPSDQAAMSKVLADLVGTTDGLIVDHATNNAIRFIPHEWDVPELRVGEGWTPSGRILLFEFQNRPQRIYLALVVGPGPQEMRETLVEAAVSSPPPLKVSRRGQRWTSIFIQDILTQRDYEELSQEEREERVREYWARLLSHELPAIKAALNIPELVTRLPGGVTDEPARGTSEQDDARSQEGGSS